MLGLLRRMPGYKLMILLLVPILIGAIAMLVLRRRSTGYDIDPVERYVVGRAAAAAAERLSAELPMRKALLMPLAGRQADGFVTDELRHRLRAEGGFEVLDRKDLSTFDGIVEQIDAFVRGLFGAGSPADVDAQTPIALAKKVGAPAVVFGKVIERGTAGGRTRCGLALRAVKVDDGKTLMAKAFEAEVHRSWASGAYRRIWMRSRAWWGRCLVWMGLVALLPLAAAGLVKPLLARELNSINAGILGAFVVLDALLAWLFLGFAGGGAVLVLVLLAALAGGVYSAIICSRLAEAAV